MVDYLFIAHSLPKPQTWRIDLPAILGNGSPHLRPESAAADAQRNWTAGRLRDCQWDSRTGYWQCVLQPRRDYRQFRPTSRRNLFLPDHQLFFTGLRVLVSFLAPALFCLANCR